MEHKLVRFERGECPAPYTSRRAVCGVCGAWGRGEACGPAAAAQADALALGALARKPCGPYGAEGRR